MPVINVTLMKGYPDEVLNRLCTRLTDAAMATIAAPADGVTVFVNEVAPAGYMRGRTAKTPGPAPRPAADICLDMLDAIGARDVERAGALTGDGFRMVFPTGAGFTDFGSLFAWSADRYSNARKTIERVEEAPLGERIAVYVSGTLSGEWTDGSPFEGVRFIDRFEVTNGKIVLQEVWNDLASARQG